jgi:hypothetical protein
MKIGDITASLYDFFGYLLPGLVATAALVFVFSSRVELWHLKDSLVVVSLFVAAYLLGHAIQAAGNALFNEDRGTKEIFCSLPEAVRGKVHEQLMKTLGTGLPDICRDPKVAIAAYAFIDESRLHSEQPNEREVYVYREGFYRGIVVATLLLGISCIIRASMGGATIALNNDAKICISATGCWIAVGVLALLSIAYGKRMYRFQKYRVERAIYYWLALNLKGTNDEEGESSASVVRVLTERVEARFDET